MTREEIGSYLGLKLETVSRAFSKFQDDGVLEVKQRQIRVLDADALQSAGQRHALLNLRDVSRPRAEPFAGASIVAPDAAVDLVSGPLQTAWSAHRPRRSPAQNTKNATE